MVTARTDFAPEFATHALAGEQRAAPMGLPPPEIVELVRRYGNTVSTALLDPTCGRFSIPGVQGAIAYRVAMGSVVGIGDPVCDPNDKITLARAFTAAAARRRLASVFAVTGEEFTLRMVDQGAAAIEFGRELVFDPRREPSKGSTGRELRKKLTHAQRAGLRAGEYDREAFPNRCVEEELSAVADEWLRGRHGPQVYLSRVRLFEAPEITRFFHVRDGDRYVGVLTTVRLDARDGYLLNHIVTKPDAPDGTSELLITHALRSLGSEGCKMAAFAATPDPELGRIFNVSPWGERIARRVFATSGRMCHLDARTHYRRKFQVANEAASFLMFDPPRVGVRQIAGLLRAFNISLA